MTVVSIIFRSFSLLHIHTSTVVTVDMSKMVLSTDDKKFSRKVTLSALESLNGQATQLFILYPFVRWRF